MIEAKESPQKMSASEYRKHVIKTSEDFIGVVMNEQQGLPAFAKEVGQYQAELWAANLVLAAHVAASLQISAKQAEEAMRGLVVAQQPGLVDQDGNPLNRQAARHIEREVAKMDSEFVEVGQ